LTPRAREFGVDFSVYNPNDKAQTVAVFIKPVPGMASVEDQGSLAQVAKQFAKAAPGQTNSTWHASHVLLATSQTLCHQGTALLWLTA